MAQPSYIAFNGSTRLARGALQDVVLAVKQAMDAEADGPLLIFSDLTGRVVDVDFRGSKADVLARLEPTPGKRGRGRPKLGVVGREVTLLPRHWDWLATQPGGVSVALRKLVDEARKAKGSATQERQAHDRAYQFAVALAGDLTGFEESMRALFAGDKKGFLEHTGSWPKDVIEHVEFLAFTHPEEA